jgi:hypothetical protein
MMSQPVVAMANSRAIPVYECRSIYPRLTIDPTSNLTVTLREALYQ